MKRILEENVSQRTEKYCHKCHTLFDYQQEDVVTDTKEWIEDDGRYGDKKIVETESSVTCPKCNYKFILSTHTHSEHLDF